MAALKKPALLISSFAACGLLLSLLLVNTGSAPVPQSGISREYQVKAVFLFNFTQFVSWPEDAFAADDSPFVIGILGKDPFGSYLDEVVQGEKLNNHPLVVRRYETIGQVENCHVLFINLEDKAQMTDALAKLRSRQILTVGDVSNFARTGGMIRFVTEERKTRIRINLDAAKAARLTISAKLLNLAEIVTTGKD